MMLPACILTRLVNLAVKVKTAREPDVVIGGAARPYLRRWYLTAWSDYPRGSKPKTLGEWFTRRLPNVYLHEVLRSDDDRALHDHPWWNLSVILQGGYVEFTIAAGGIHHGKFRAPGSLKLRPPQSAHRLVVSEPCTTLFITGPRVRDWGFHCPQGWRHWKEFVSAADPGQPGRGCE